MFMKIVIGMRGNHSSGQGSPSLGRGRGSQQNVRGRGIQNFFTGNTTNILPHSPTSTEDIMSSPPLDTPVVPTTNIPSLSHSAPAENMRSIPPTSGGASNATAASATACSSQSMPSMQSHEKIFIQPTRDNRQ